MEYECYRHCTFNKAKWIDNKLHKIILLNNECALKIMTLCEGEQLEVGRAFILIKFQWKYLQFSLIEVICYSSLLSE